MPGQEPAQVGGLLRGHPEHRVAAGGEEHRDRQPRRAGRLDHHLQPASRRAPGQRRRLHRGQALHGGPGLALGHDGRPPRPAPAPCAPWRRPSRCRPAACDSSRLPCVACRIPPARPQGRRTIRPRSQGRCGQPRLPLMCCNRADPTGRPTSLIRGIRGQARGGNQLHEARPAGLPQSGFSTPPPGPAGMTMQPLGTSAPWWIHENRCPLHDQTPQAGRPGHLVRHDLVVVTRTQAPGRSAPSPTGRPRRRLAYRLWGLRGPRRASADGRTSHVAE